MPETAVYAPGTPIWVDLGSPEVEASKQFYCTLFGWEAHTEPDPQAGGYTMFKLNGKSVCGVGPIMSEGQPPAWSTYISTESCDATASAVERAGGRVLMPPMDVMDAGRMAVCCDPTGAIFGLWQSGRHQGAEIFNQPNTVCWNECWSRDIESAKSFYTQVFTNWNPSPVDFGGTEYWEIKIADKTCGGMMPMPQQMPDNIPSYWLNYFAVEDCEATCAKVKELGGQITQSPTDIPQGTMAICADNYGAAFAIIQISQGG